MTNAIETAVLPLKSQAMERAAADSRRLINGILADLAAHNWDVNAAAPRANGNMSREQYTKLMSKHNLYLSVTAFDPSQSVRRMSDPHKRIASAAAEERFVAAAIELAATQYVAFVAKLVGKIGAVDSATLAGSHVWGYSILTVTKSDGSSERWQTQQIVNQSKLGTLFNQWPSRKVK